MEGVEIDFMTLNPVLNYMVSGGQKARRGGGRPEKRSDLKNCDMIQTDFPDGLQIQSVTHFVTLTVC